MLFTGVHMEGEWTTRAGLCHGHNGRAPPRPHANATLVRCSTINLTKWNNGFVHISEGGEVQGRPTSQLTRVVNESIWVCIMVNCPSQIYIVLVTPN